MFLFLFLTGLLLPARILAHSDDEVLGSHMFGSGMWGGWFFMIIFWIIGVTLFIFFIKWIIDQGKSGDKSIKSPLDILKERYASGEINKEEFEQMKKDLQ